MDALPPTLPPSYTEAMALAIAQVERDKNLAISDKKRRAKIKPSQCVDAEVGAYPVQARPKEFAVTNLRRDLEWIYQTLDVDDIVVGPPPSPGAQSLRLWARDNRKDFYLSIFNRILPTKRELEADESQVDDGRTLVLLDGLLRGYATPYGQPVLQERAEGPACEPAAPPEPDDRGQ